MTFDELIAQFERQRGQKLMPKEVEGCRQLWETMQQQEKPG